MALYSTDKVINDPARMESLDAVIGADVVVEDDICEIERTAPQLRPLWHLVGPDRIRSTSGYRSQEVLKTLKMIALKNGLMPSAWRYLCWLDEAEVKAILGGNGGQLAERLEYANYFSRVGARPYLDRWFAGFIVLYSLLEKRGFTHKNKLYAFTRRVFQESWIRRESKKQFVDEVMYIVEWFVHGEARIEQGGEYSKKQSRAPWSWWLSQAERYHKQQYRVPPKIKDVTWHSLLEPFMYQDYEVVPIISARELYRESQELRHCVYTYVERCCSGASRIFSVRREDGERYATFEIALRDEKWVLVQVRSSGNRRPDDGAIYAARETLRRYRNVWEPV